MSQKRALILFIFIILAISIPLMLVIRAKIDLDMERDLIAEPKPAVHEPAPLPEPDVVTNDHPLIPTDGLDQDPYKERPSDDSVSVINEPTDEPSDQGSEQELCESAGGNWNICGSPCRNLEPDMACIEMCVSQCECGGVEEWTCPSDTVCEDYEPLPRTASSTGVCR
jgi:hypothetical protein